MNNSRISLLRAALSHPESKKDTMTREQLVQVQEWNTELSGLLADRLERIAVRFHAQFITALMPLVKSKKELEKIEAGGARLAEIALTHAQDFCDTFDKELES